MFVNHVAKFRCTTTDYSITWIFNDTVIDELNTPLGDVVPDTHSLGGHSVSTLTVLARVEYNRTEIRCVSGRGDIILVVDLYVQGTVCIYMYMYSILIVLCVCYSRCKGACTCIYMYIVHVHMYMYVCTCRVNVYAWNGWMGNMCLYPYCMALLHMANSEYTLHMCICMFLFSLSLQILCHKWKL